MTSDALKELTREERALVAVAVLLDGMDAGLYLEPDSRKGALLKQAATQLSQLQLDLRMPFVGTMLRLALEEAE